MKISIALLLLALAATAGAVTFDVTNEASSTAGGQRFDQEYGADYAKQVLSDASSFTWGIFNQPDPSDRRPADGDTVTLAVRDTDGIAATSGSTVELSARYVGGITGDDLKEQVTGVLYHEVAHVWQWGLQDYGAHSGVFEGIADYVRLKAGYVPGHWVKEGGGDRWDQGYDVTARFLDYCDSLKPGFVAGVGLLRDCGIVYRAIAKCNHQKLDLVVSPQSSRSSALRASTKLTSSPRLVTSDYKSYAQILQDMQSSHCLSKTIYPPPIVQDTGHKNPSVSTSILKSRITFYMVKSTSVGERQQRRVDVSFLWQ
ncbi:hypothetical protein TRIUR3_33397 [Triticum urartu]|uniref:Basic secretory protease n=1 Tax=Triticum urartu TaxID=4572 RepID=M7ZQ40_TRIUA|nr:hypothetical protein TRIUR3_33397 [Triticum urartu]